MTKKISEEIRLIKAFCEWGESFQELHKADTAICVEGHDWYITDVGVWALDQEIVLELNNGDAVVKLILLQSLPSIAVVIWGDACLESVTGYCYDDLKPLLRLAYWLPSSGSEARILTVRDDLHELDYPTPELVRLLAYFVEKFLEKLGENPSVPFAWQRVVDYATRQQELVQTMLDLRKGAIQDCWVALSDDWDDLQT